MSWRWDAPDGSYCELADEIPDTRQVRLGLLDFWYEGKICGFRGMRDAERFRIEHGVYDS